MVAQPEPGHPARLVIHIGLQKTGTTFLQRSLHRHRTALAAHGLIYPNPGAGLNAGGGRAHHFLAHAVLGRRLRHTPADGFDRLEPHVAALRAAWRAAAPEAGGTALISSEDFSLLGPRQIHKLRALFPDEEVRILVYLRRQDQWLEALYGQMLKQGRHQTPGTFVARNRRRADYAALLERWGAVFGNENLIVRAYEGFETGGLWADFCTALQLPTAAALVSDRVQVNVSLSREASTFLSAIRNDRWRHGLRLMLERGQTRPPRPGLRYVSPELADRVMAEHRDGNARVAAQYLTRAQLFQDAAPLAAVPRPSWPVRQALVLRQLMRGMWLEFRDWLRRGRRRG